jgi:uncharacterized protein DUF5681
MDSRNNAERTRGRPFEPGNPGRPKGSRNKATLTAEMLLDGEADKLTRKAIELALAGDVTALRLCMERIVPPRKDRPVLFNLLKMNTGADAAKGVAAIVTAVASGDLTPSEAAELSKVIEAYARALETSDLEARIAKLEGSRP